MTLAVFHGMAHRASREAVQLSMLPGRVREPDASAHQGSKRSCHTTRCARR